MTSLVRFFRSSHPVIARRRRILLRTVGLAVLALVCLVLVVRALRM